MKILKVISTLTLTFALSAAAHAADAQFPLGPDPTLTPGSLCATPDEYRHPEKVAYCKRDVDRDAKVDVIHQYDAQLGFHIEAMNRVDFKIDHLIPLCFGGSNEKSNLWPQHKSVYTQTDPLENKLCILLQSGKITQKAAIDQLLEAKHDLSKCADLNRDLDGQIKSR